MLQAPVQTASVQHSPPVRLHQPLPAEFRERFAPDISPSWRVVGIFWVDGADHEPGGWEVIAMAPLMSDLLKHGSNDPEAVRLAIGIFMASTKATSAEQVRQIVVDGYKQVPQDKHKAVETLLGKIQEMRAVLAESAKQQAADPTTKGLGSEHVEVIYLHESLVVSTHRRLTSEQGANQLVTRRVLEESTALDEDDEPEAETEPSKDESAS